MEITVRWERELKVYIGSSELPSVQTNLSKFYNSAQHYENENKHKSLQLDTSVCQETRMEKV